MEIKELQKKDWNKVIGYAIRGMHFDEYLENDFLLKAYGRYFWYLEYTNATQVIAAYDDDELLGVLLVDVKGEPRLNKSFFKSVYIRLVDFTQKIFFRGSVKPYNDANNAMLADYTKDYSPDGEIRFLAANPDGKTKGVGTFLLNELANREHGKELYLFTDSNCTYQFYEHRGFERIGEKEIAMELSGEVKMKCLLYRKQL